MNTLRLLWQRYKSFQFPWRKKWLVGYDLAGNSFWVFKDANNANRLRRIMQHGPLSHYADIQISPQWHQWLRHTRDEAPTIQELQLDEMRKARIKELAAAADARWASQKSFLDTPDMQQPVPAIGVKDPGGYASPTEDVGKRGVRSAVESQPVAAVGEALGSKEDTGLKGIGETKEPSWKAAPSGAGEGWQPKPWKPGPKKKK